MKKEEAFEAMRKGAVLSHTNFIDIKHIRRVDGVVVDENNKHYTGLFPAKVYDFGWYIVSEPNQSSNSDFLLKEIILHLEDSKRVWNYSGHEYEPAIAKGVRLLNGEIEMLKLENGELKRLLNSRYYGDE